MANYAQTVNVIGCIKTTKTDAFFAATGLPLKLYRDQFGTLPVKVDGSDDSLDVMAALTADKKALTIGVVNASWDTHRLDLDFNDLKPARTAEHWFIADKNPLAYNDPDHVKKLAIQKGKKTNMTKTLVIKPLSINLYRVPVK